MYRLVIVEDEKSIFYLLNSSILYEDLGLELAGHADDGREGLELILREKPDIVITDITMPLMDGLELIEAAAKRQVTARFIIVSGYAQFSFAQKAVSLGVRDYLLKPINADELNHSLARLIAEMADGNEPKAGSLPDSSAASKLRNSWMMSLLYHEPALPEMKADDVNSEYMYAFSEGIFLTAEIHVDYCVDTVVGVKRHILDITEQMLHEALKDICTEYQTISYRDSVYAVLNGREDELRIEKLEAILQNVLELIRSQTDEYTKTCITAAVGVTTDDIRLLLSSLQSAENSMANRIVRGTDRVLLPLQPYGEQTAYRIPQDLYDRIGEQVECDRPDELKEAVRDMLADVLSFCRQTSAEFGHAMEEALLRLFNLIREKGSFPDSMINLYRKHRDTAKDFFREEDLLRRLPEDIVSDILAFQKENSPETSGIMRRVLAYIGDNYQKQLRLEDVAEQVYMSPAYLGVLFKKETGENFSAYLTNIRLQKAKELLMDERLNIGEIGYRIGYGNSRYFSRIFKENVGITPKEYRRIHAGRLY